MQFNSTPNRHPLHQGQAGFSLMETMIAMTIMTIVIGGAVSLTSLVKGHLFKSNQNGIITALEGSAKTYAGRVSSFVKFEWFDPASTFSRQHGNLENDLELINSVVTNARLVSINFHHQGKLYKNIPRTSSMLELRRLDNSIDKQENALIISRCIPKNKIRKKWKLHEILELERIPIISEGKLQGKKGKHHKVKCCLHKPGEASPNCKSGSMNKKNVKWRPRLFFVNKNSVRAYPRYQERRYVLGAGFSAYFDDNNKPSSFVINTFTLVNNCISAKDAKFKIKEYCKPFPNTKVTSFVETRSIYEQKFEDAGMLELGK